MPLVEVDVPALGVQDVGRHAGEDVEVGQQLEKLLLVKKNIHGISLLMDRDSIAQICRFGNNIAAGREKM